MVSNVGPQVTTDWSQMQEVYQQEGAETPQEIRGLGELFTWDILISEEGERSIRYTPNRPQLPVPEPRPPRMEIEHERMNLLSVLTKVGDALKDFEEQEKKELEQLLQDKSSLIALFDRIFNGEADALLKKMEKLNDLNNKIEGIGDDKNAYGKKKVLQYKKKKLRKKIKKELKEMGIKINSGKKLTKLLKSYNEMGITPENALMIIISTASPNGKGDLEIKNGDLERMNKLSKELSENLEVGATFKPEELNQMLLASAQVLADDRSDNTYAIKKEEFLNFSTNLLFGGSEDYFADLETFITKEGGEVSFQEALNSPFFYTEMMNTLTETDAEGIAHLNLEEKVYYLFDLLEFTPLTNINGEGEDAMKASVG